MTWPSLICSSRLKPVAHAFMRAASRLISTPVLLSRERERAVAESPKRATGPVSPVQFPASRLRAARHITLILSAAATLSAATVSGTVELHESRMESVSRGQDYSGVVVSLQAVNQSTTAADKHVTMLQKNKMFTPHILPVIAGTTVDFPNADPIFHSAFSSYSGQIFDVGLYPPGTSRSVRFQRPGIVRVFCNIHPAMSAIILVLPTPHFTVTPHDGSFHLDVPPGSYDLSIYHERATEQSLQSLARRILVPAEGIRIPPIVVSEAGYLMAPHKNKYGKDYEPPPDDKAFYPGSHQ